MTACDGTSSALSSMYSCSRTFRNSPGHRTLSRFWNSPFKRTVPVVVSTLLFERQDAFAEHRVGLRRAHEYRQAVLAIALDVAEVLLRHGEAHEDRMDLVDHHQRIR